jgi:hypothetical protein
VHEYINIYIQIYIGSTLAKIDNCPLQFKAYKLIHAFVDIPELVNMLVMNYATQAVTQVYMYIHVLVLINVLI